MRKLIVLAVLVVIGLGMAGCGPKDAHEMYIDRNLRITQQADSRSLIDDIQTNWLMDDRPSHLSFFVQD